MTGSKEMFGEEQQKQAEAPNELKDRNFPVIQMVLNPNSLLDINKASIKNLATHVRYNIRSGLEDGLDALIAAKKLEKLGKDIVETIKADVYGKSYAAKGEILKRNGAEVEQCEVGVDWDFANCNDVILNNLLAKQAELNEKIKDRQEYLKVVTTISKQVDMETGEEYEINPPIRTATVGYRITLK